MAAFAWSKALYVRDCLPFGLPLPPSIWAMKVDAFARRHNKSAFLAFCNGQFGGISHVQQLAEGPRYNGSKCTSDFLDLKKKFFFENETLLIRMILPVIVFPPICYRPFLCLDHHRQDICPLLKIRFLCRTSEHFHCGCKNPPLLEKGLFLMAQNLFYNYTGVKHTCTQWKISHYFRSF